MRQHRPARARRRRARAPPAPAARLAAAPASGRGTAGATTASAGSRAAAPVCHGQCTSERRARHRTEQRARADSCTGAAVGYRGNSAGAGAHNTAPAVSGRRNVSVSAPAATGRASARTPTVDTLNGTTKRLPGAAWSVAGSGNAWTNPTSALTDNNAGAYAGGQTPSATQLLRLRNFGFDAEVPANAEIVGVVVELKRQSNYATADRWARDEALRLTATSDAGVGDNLADQVTHWPGGTWGAVQYGGTRNGWNAGLTAAAVRSIAFGLVLAAYTNSAAPLTVNAYVDYAAITVYWRVPKGEVAPPTATAGAQGQVPSASGRASRSTPTASAARPRSNPDRQRPHARARSAPRSHRRGTTRRPRPTATGQGVTVDRSVSAPSASAGAQAHRPGSSAGSARRASAPRPRAPAQPQTGPVRQRAAPGVRQRADRAHERPDHGQRPGPARCVCHWPRPRRRTDRQRAHGRHGAPARPPTAGAPGADPRHGRGRRGAGIVSKAFPKLGRPLPDWGKPRHRRNPEPTPARREVQDAAEPQLPEDQGRGAGSASRLLPPHQQAMIPSSGTLPGANGRPGVGLVRSAGGGTDQRERRAQAAGRERGRLEGGLWEPGRRDPGAGRLLARTRRPQANRPGAVRPAAPHEVPGRRHLGA